MRNTTISKHKIKVNVTNIINENMYKRLTLSIQGKINGKRNIITLDWIVNKNFNIDPENILKDIVEKLRILKISNFKYESFVKYLNVDKKCFSLIVSAYKLFKKMLGVKMLQQFLET